MKYVLLGVLMLAAAVGYASWRLAPPAEPTLTVLNVDAFSTTLNQIDNDWGRVFGEEACKTDVGLMLFIYKGCASCHGQNGEGSSSVPSLVGVDLTQEQVRRQVRNPKGAMPAFSEAQITDSEMDMIDTYVTSLDPNGEYWVWSEP